jgi:OmpA family
MEQALDADGKIALYGILFDFDKDVIKPESKPALDEIAALLNGKPDLKVKIVGHTDNQGMADYNLNLSKRRAASVVAALTGPYGIAADRLASEGMGASQPVDTNDTDAGRAKNRRVELVAQGAGVRRPPPRRRRHQRLTAKLRRRRLQRPMAMREAGVTEAARPIRIKAWASSSLAPALRPR